MLTVNPFSSYQPTDPVPSKTLGARHLANTAVQRSSPQKPQNGVAITARMCWSHYLLSLLSSNPYSLFHMMPNEFASLREPSTIYFASALLVYPKSGRNTEVCCVLNTLINLRIPFFRRRFLACNARLYISPSSSHRL